MAILRSVDGKFFDVPDKELDKFEVPAEQVKELLGAAGQMGEAGPAAPMPQAQSGDVDPYWCWRNWRNCYCWRNCY